MSDVYRPVEVGLADCPFGEVARSTLDHGVRDTCDYPSCFPIEGQPNIHIKWQIGGMTWSKSPEHLRFSVSSRGFKAMVNVDGLPSVRESSSAEAPKVWIEDDHMTVEEALRAVEEGHFKGVTAEQIKWLCDHHYQGAG